MSHRIRRAAPFFLTLILSFCPCRFARCMEAYEHVILQTDAGDIVLKLFPDVAPKTVEQFLKLAKAGCYDGTRILHLVPDLVAQVSSAQNDSERSVPLTPEQKALLHPLKAEYGNLRHTRGRLTMARTNENDPDSAMTSFSIVLQDTPGFDNKYTVFGEVQDGYDAVKEIIKVPVDKHYEPVTPIAINKALVINAKDLLSYKLAPAKPIFVSPELIPPKVNVPMELVVGMLLIVLNGALTFFLSPRLTPSAVRSLNLVNVFFSAFIVMVVLVPMAETNAKIGTMLFFGLLALIKLMGKFESPA